MNKLQFPLIFAALGYVPLAAIAQITDATTVSNVSLSGVGDGCYGDSGVFSIGCSEINGYARASNNPTATANQVTVNGLNTGGTSSTAVGNITGSTTITGSSTNITGTGGTTVKGGTNSGTLNLNDGNAAGGTNITISGSGGGTAATVFQTTTDASTTTVNTTVGTSAVYSGGSTATLQAGPINSVTVKSGNTGAAPGVSIQGVVGTGSTSHTGVLITGSGQNGVSYTNDDRAAGTIPTWADVAIQSKSYGLGDPTLGSAILVTDYGVQILSPQPIAGQSITNNTGINNSTGIIVNNNGSNTSSGSVVNNNGMNSGSGSVVNNSGGTSGSGSATNNIGMNTSTTGGTATNNIGGVSGNGSVTNGFGNNTSTTYGVANNSLGMNSGNGTTDNIFGGNTGSGSTTNVIGQNDGTGTVTNSFGTGTGVTTNNIGNSNTSSTVNMNAGSSSMRMSDGLVSIAAGTPLATNGTTGTTSASGSGGLSIYNSAQTVAAGTTIANSLAGKQYQNKINGNLMVDGNVYINGTLDYVSSNSANTTVVGSGVGTSVLQGAFQGTTGGTAIVMKGTSGTQAVVDANGRITMTNQVAAQSSASLTLTNGYGNTHGIVVTEGQTSISGGTRSSTLTLNDNGATFSNAATGSPVQVHGVADGTGDFDAVNVRQLGRGIAMSSALAAMPPIEYGKTYNLSAGVGNYMGQTALAVGGSVRIAENATFRAGLSSAQGGGRPVANAGVGISF